MQVPLGFVHEVHPTLQQPCGGRLAARWEVAIELFEPPEALALFDPSTEGGYLGALIECVDPECLGLLIRVMQGSIRDLCLEHFHVLAQ